MLSITNYQRNVSQNYNVVSPNTDQNSHHQKVYSQCWRGCGEKGTLLYCCWECKLLHLLWRTVSMFLKKLKIELPIHSVQLLTGIAGSHGSSPFTFLRKHSTVFHSGCTILRFHQCPGVLASPHVLQRLFSGLVLLFWQQPS